MVDEEAPAPSPPSTLPQSIGMSLSGGGYRAAAFHLGALAYLDHASLIDKLEAISTVSGGTFTGARYALAQVSSLSFAEFFRGMYGDLARFDLVELGLARLAGGTPTVPSGRDDLIVSLAQVYAETFFRTKTGGTHLFGEILRGGSGMEEIVFNATEFRTGIAFRFQKSLKGRIGNGNIYISAEDASKIRVADIVAASSCFPGGFEPLAFPDDFAWPNGVIPPDVDRVIKEGGKLGPLPVMDGGIYDNQGVGSLLLADERRDEDLDLFIISDVSQPSSDMYPFPETDTTSGPTVGAIHFAARGLMIICALTAVIETFEVWAVLRAGDFSAFDFFRYVVPMALAGSSAFILWWGRRTLRREMNRIPRMGRAAWKDLRRLRLGQVIAMVRLRITSLYAMASSVFMARIRGLVYGTIYTDEHYKDKRVSNLVYDLLPSRRFFFQDDPRVPAPSKELYRVVEAAVNMPTTLWFEDDRPHELPCLVAAGQATLCYNLMKFVVRRWGTDETQYPDFVARFWERLLSDWKAMVADPYVLIEPLWPEGLAPPEAADRFQ